MRTPTAHRAPWHDTDRVHARSVVVAFALLLMAAVPGAAQTPIVFNFENLAATYSEVANPCTFPPRQGLLSNVSMTVSGLTVDITRVSANFDIVANVGCQSGKPGSWGARSLDPFVSNTNTPFNLNFSTGIFSFSVEWGDYGGDADIMTLSAFSGLNGTGANLGTVQSSTYPATNFLPTIFTTSISSGTPIRSIRMIGGGTGPTLLNSVFYDNLTVQSTQLTVSGAGGGTGTVTTPVGFAPIINCTSTAGATTGTCQQTYGNAVSVTLNATPAAGSIFSGWSGACTGMGSCVVSMSQARDVTATFSVQTFPLTVSVGGNGTGTVASAPAGISACSATGGDCSEPYNFNTQVTLTATPGAGSSTTWAGCGSVPSANQCVVTMSQARNVTATFTLSTHQLTVTPGGNGTGTVASAPAGISGCSATGGDCTQVYNFNTQVTLTATPGAGSSTTWGGCDSVPSANQCMVTITQARTVTTTFTLSTHQLTVTPGGNGTGTVASNPAGITGCSATGGDCSQVYNYNTQVTLTATPGAGSSTIWAGCGSVPSANTCVVTMTQARTVGATFELSIHQLTVTPGGNGSGTVASAPAGITGCSATGGDCTQVYNYNTQVTLTATPGAGSSTTWGGCDSVPSASQCVVTITQARTVTTTFTLSTHQLTVTTGGNGSGTVSSVPAGIANCGNGGGDCTEPYNYNTQVTLTATPGTGASTGWAGCDSVPSANQCVVTITQARTVTATFTLGAHSLTVTTGGNGSGTVSSVPAGIANCGNGGGDCAEPYNFNTQVTLTATPGAGSSTTWAGCDSVPSANQCVVTMTQARNVTATFTAPPQTLTVAGGGTGSGTVTSQAGLTPAINCTITNGVVSGACSQTYPFNTSATLTAAVTGGSTFSGWSGACTGTAGCTVAMTQAQNVTASFLSGTTTLTGLTPARGSTAGGTSVQVGGERFVAGGTSVTVGGVAATSIVVRSSTEMSFVTPAGSPGVAPVVVATANSSATGSFTYVVPEARRLAGARRPSFSFDGRYMAFESIVALVADDTNGVADVYVFDKIAGTLRRVSISSAGGQALGGESQNGAISATGRFVAFESRATNLVASDANDLLDVFLHDRDSDNDGVFDEPGAIRTVRISVNTAGGEAAAGFSRNPSISGNGRWVTFESAATNLVGSDTNGHIDICVHDRLLGITKRLNIHSNGAQAVGGDSARPVISLDGRYVAFDSIAANLVSSDANGRRDVFVHDRDTDGDGVMDEAGFVATARVSVSSLGVEAVGGDSTDASITQEGRWVAFASTAANLVPNDTNQESDVFLHDRVTGTTRRLSVGPNGTDLPGPSRAPRISANGATLVFLTSGLNIPSATGSVTAAATAIHAFADDGKSTTGVIPSPTNPEPPPPSVDPLPPDGNDEDPEVSGDGSQTGTTVTPAPGGGNPAPSIETVGVPEAADEPPFISGLAPASGPVSGGQIVEIQGSHFTSTSTVRWGTQTLTPEPGGTSTLLRVSAPGTALAQPVEVQARDGMLSSNVVTYTYLVAQSTPVITSVSPASGPVTGAQAVTINGTGFDTPSVRFGPFAATVTGSTQTSISVATPAALVAGPVPVVVTNQDGGLAVSDGPFDHTPVSGDAPTITAVQPSHGLVTGGTTLTILGSQFTPDATVMIGGVAAMQVQFLSSAALVATTPAGPIGPAPLTVTVPGLLSATMPFEYRAVALAVTACTGTVDEDLDGVPDNWETQFGLSASDASDGALDWDGDGRSNLQECQDGTHPRGLYTRYLAEGATGSFFSTRVAVANPGVMPARVLFRFLTQTGVTVPHVLVVPAGARRTLDLETLGGLEDATISTVVESDAEVVVDRTMRWDQATRGGAHAEGSVPAPALRWYLAEGATHGAFDLFYLIQNPSLTSAASVRIRFLLPAGAPLEHFYTVAANSRFTLPVDGVPGLAATDVSAVIESLNGIPVIVERAMYSSAAGVFAAGHNSAGVTALSSQWFFAEGATGSFFDLFLLFANPNATDAQIRAVYLLPSGQTVEKAYTVPANSRRTINVAFEDPALADTAVSVTIQSQNGVPIIAERAMWWPHGQAWHEAHNSAGSTATGTKWAVADGEHGGGEATQTYILVANTSAATARLRVTVLLETGAPLIREYTVAANSRFNVPVGADFSLPAGTRFGAVVESLGAVPAQIVVERAMYWNAGGVIWAAGSNLLATKLQ